MRSPPGIPVVMVGDQHHSAHLRKSQGLVVGRGFFWFGFAITYLGGLSAVAGTSTQLITGVFAFVGGSLLTFSGFRRPIRNAIAAVRNSPSSPEAQSAARRPHASGAADGEHPPPSSKESDEPRSNATSEKPETKPSPSTEQHAKGDTPQSAAPPEHIDATRVSVALGGFSTGLIAGAPSGIALRLLGSALLLKFMPTVSGPDAPNPVPSSAPVASTVVQAEHAPPAVLGPAVSTAEPEHAKKEPAPPQKPDVAHQTLALFAMQAEEVEQCLQIARNAKEYKDPETKAMIQWLWRQACCHDERLASHQLCGDAGLTHK